MRFECRQSAIEQGEVRLEWWNAAARELQVAAGAIALAADGAGLHTAVSQCVAAIPKPETAPERLLLRGVCLEFALRVGLSFHRRFHGGQEAACQFDVTSSVAWVLNADPSGPLQSLETWAGSYATEFSRCHPLSAVDRAATLLMKDHGRRWDDRALAAHVGVTPSHLRRSFRRRYGMSPRDFHMNARTIAALGAIRTHKVEAVALQVGFRSKKNLYRRVRSLTGVTPAAFRLLSAERATDLIESATLRLRPRGPA